MNYAEIKRCDVANGPGVRVSLFVSGCTHRCKGCFNEEAWDFQFGKPFTQEVQEQLLSSLDHDYIEGLTLLGGWSLPIRKPFCLLSGQSGNVCRRKPSGALQVMILKKIFLEG